MINDLPTVFEVVTGSVKPANEGTPHDNNSKSKSSAKMVGEFFWSIFFFLLSGQV